MGRTKHYDSCDEEQELLSSHNLDSEGVAQTTADSVEQNSQANNNGTARWGNGKFSRRQMMILSMFVGTVVAVTIVVSIVLFTNAGSDALSDNRKVRSDRKITLDDVLSGKFSYERYSMEWISDDSFIHHEDAIIEIQASDLQSRGELLTQAESGYSRKSDVERLSPDRKYFMFANNTKQLYRHSFFADYYIKNLKTGVIKRIRTPDTEDERIRYCGWSAAKNALVMVYKNNIYYLDTAESRNYYQITKDGVDKKVFNGVPDWVYEEEILAATHAIEFSQNGRYMVYGKFNATMVPFYKFPIYGAEEHQYTDIQKIAYPKAGFPNPTILLSVIDLHAVVGGTQVTHTALNPPDALAKAEYYYTIMKFNGDKVFVQWMNRYQNNTICALYQPGNSVGLTLEKHTVSGGWVDDDYVSPKFSKDHSYYITMLPKTEGSSGEWRHLAKVDISPSGGSTKFLTSGKFTVQDINCYDEDNEIVYYRSSVISPKYRHVYSYDIKQGLDKCLTCDLNATESGEKCMYYYPSFSKKCSWVVLLCQGPIIPTSTLFNLKTKKVERYLVENNRLRAQVKEYDMPNNTYYSVKSDGFDIQVKETRPKNFDKNKKYAVLFDVYGGPNTQKVLEMQSIHYSEYLVSNFDILVVQIDARGAATYGYRFLHAVYKNLGYYEVQDTLAVARHLKAQSYVDPEKIAIWGWSYGGFYSASVLAWGGDEIKTAIAVAPVTDWRYYDTVYTERYMGLPTKEDNLRGYENTAIMTRASQFKGKNFLLIHGTADDNVHFQNSAQLSAALIKENIKFRQQYYPDLDHSIETLHIWRLLADYILAHLVKKT